MALNDNLIRYFKFDGNLNDETGNGSIVQAIPTTFDSVSKSVYFDGVTENLTYMANPLISQTQWTISFQIKNIYLNAFATIFSFYQRGATPKVYGVELLVNSNSTFGLWYGNTQKTNTLPHTDSKWQHCIFAYNNGTMRVYINGILKYYLTGDTFPSENMQSVELSLGQYLRGPYVLDRKFKGNLKNFRVWDREITSTKTTLNDTGDLEVAELYSLEGTGVSINDYIAYWKLDGNINPEIVGKNLSSGGTPIFESGNKARVMNATSQLSYQNDLVRNKNYSISLWIKPEYTSGTPYLITSADATVGFCLVMINSTTVRVQENNTASPTVYNTFTIENGILQNFIITFSLITKELKVYLDGVYATSITLTQTPYGDYEIDFMSKDKTNNILVGTIDDIRVYWDTLTQDNITQLYATTDTVHTGFTFKETQINGLGTSLDPYNIKYSFQLNDMRNSPYNGVGKYCIISNDIDTTNPVAGDTIYANWTPINSFTSNFDGQGNTIKYAITSNPSTAWGLFAAIGENNQIIENAILDVNINHSGTTVGSALCGTILADKTNMLIQNIIGTGSIALSNVGNKTISGVVNNTGSANTGEIRRCINKINISNNGTIYGVAGGFYNVAWTITQCANYGELKSYSDSYLLNSAGVCDTGVFNHVSELINYGNIVSYSSGNTATHNSGVASYNGEPNINNCVNYGEVGLPTSLEIKNQGICANKLGSTTLPVVEKCLHRGQTNGAYGIANITSPQYSIFVGNLCRYNIDAGIAKRTFGTSKQILAISENSGWGDVGCSDNYRYSLFEDENGNQSTTFPDPSYGNNGTLVLEATLKGQAIYSSLGWNFTTVWYILEDYEYPILQWNMLQPPTFSYTGGQ